MAQRLKRWESPRREGRNHQGRGGTAKQRQYLKRQKLWRRRLTETSSAHKPDARSNSKGEAKRLSSFL